MCLMLWVPVIPSRCRARNKHIRMWIRGVYCRQKVLELGLMGTGIPFVPFPSNNPDEVRFDPEEYDHCERQNCVFVDLFSWTDWTRSGPCSVCEGRETRNEVFLREPFANCRFYPQFGSVPFPHRRPMAGPPLVEYQCPMM